MDNPHPLLSFPSSTSQSAMCNRFHHLYACDHVLSEKAPCATSKSGICGKDRVTTLNHEHECDYCDHTKVLPAVWLQERSSAMLTTVGKSTLEISATWKKTKHHSSASPFYPTGNAHVIINNGSGGAEFACDRARALSGNRRPVSPSFTDANFLLW